MRKWLTGLLVIVAACGYSHGSHSRSAQNGRTVQLVVENDNWQDITVYLERSGVRQRLGQVEAARQDTLEVAESLITGGRVAFMLQPLGTRGTRVYGEMDRVPFYGSYRYRVTDVPFPGGTAEIKLWIAPRLAQSHVRFWR